MLDNPPHPQPITTPSACCRQTAAGEFKCCTDLLTVTWADRQYPNPELGQHWSDRCTCLIGEVGILTLSGHAHTHIPALYSGTKPRDNPSNAVTLGRLPHCNPARRLGKHTHKRMHTKARSSVALLRFTVWVIHDKRKGHVPRWSMSHSLSRQRHRTKVKEAWRGRGVDGRRVQKNICFSKTFRRFLVHFHFSEL